MFPNLFQCPTILFWTLRSLFASDALSSPPVISQQLVWAPAVVDRGGLDLADKFGAIDRLG